MRDRCNTDSGLHHWGSGIPWMIAAVVWLRNEPGASSVYGRHRSSMPWVDRRGTRMPLLGRLRSLARVRLRGTPMASAALVVKDRPSRGSGSANRLVIAPLDRKWLHRVVIIHRRAPCAQLWRVERFTVLGSVTACAAVGGAESIPGRLRHRLCTCGEFKRPALTAREQPFGGTRHSCARATTSPVNATLGKINP